MALDSSIITGVKPIAYEPPDPISQFAKGLQLKALMTQDRVAQQAYQDDQASRQALQSSGGDMSQYLKNLAAGGSPTAYQSALKAQREQEAAQADIDYKRAHGKKFLNDVQVSNIAQHRDQLAGVNTPQDAITWAQSGVQSGVLTPEQGQLAVQNINAAQTPEAFNTWKQQAALGATKFIEMNKPTYLINKVGATTDTLAIPGLGGAPQVISSVKNTVSPDAQLQANTSRANNAATIAKDFKINMIDPQTGNFIGTGPEGQIDGIVDAIGKNQIPLSTALARVPPGMKSGIMQQLLTKYPDFDETAIGTRQKANRDFTTGPQGNAMRSFAVAGQHLDQLGELADGLTNGNMQIVNKAANIYAQQTGKPAPTNFEAAKDVVSKEVVKAIVAGGGGVAERQELSNLMSQVKSPAQLKGVIEQYRNLMDAQHSALLEQRRAAGLSDSSLPNYSLPAGQAPAIPDMSAIDAEIARRSGKKTITGAR